MVVCDAAFGYAKDEVVASDGANVARCNIWQRCEWCDEEADAEGAIFGCDEDGAARVDGASVDGEHAADAEVSGLAVEDGEGGFLEDFNFAFVFDEVEEDGDVVSAAASCDVEEWVVEV